MAKVGVMVRIILAWLLENKIEGNRRKTIRIIKIHQDYFDLLNSSFSCKMG